MTFADLLEQLNSLTPTQLQQEVTVHVTGVGETYTALDFVEADEDQSDLGLAEGMRYLTI